MINYINKYINNIYINNEDYYIDNNNHKYIYLNKYIKYIYKIYFKILLTFDKNNIDYNNLNNYLLEI